MLQALGRALYSVLFIKLFLKLTIRCKDIVKLTKERTARVIPNAIQILTKDEKFFFTSFGTRDKTYLVLDHVWRSGIADEVREYFVTYQAIPYMMIDALIPYMMTCHFRC